MIYTPDQTDFIGLYDRARTSGNLKQELQGLVRGFLEQHKPAGDAKELSPDKIKSIDLFVQDTVDIFFSFPYTTSSVIDLKKLKGIPLYHDFLKKIRGSKKRGKLEQEIDSIIRGIIEKEKEFSYHFHNYLDFVSEHRFNEETYRSARVNPDGTIEIFYQDSFNPWINLQFRQGFKSLVVRGGLFLYKYTLDDECSLGDGWSHVFYLKDELDTALDSIAESAGNIKKQVELRQGYEPVKEGIILAPSRFYKSEKTGEVQVCPLAFEVREEVLPVSALSFILSNLKRVLPKNPASFKHHYMEPATFEYSDVRVGCQTHAAEN